MYTHACVDACAHIRHIHLRRNGNEERVCGKVCVFLNDLERTDGSNDLERTDGSNDLERTDGK